MVIVIKVSNAPVKFFLNDIVFVSVILFYINKNMLVVSIMHFFTVFCCLLVLIVVLDKTLKGPSLIGGNKLFATGGWNNKKTVFIVC